MANYRIWVERLNDEVEISEELERGIEVDGFAFLADVDDDLVMNVICHMSIKMIAQAMDGDEPFVKAALLSRLMAALSKGESNE